MSKNEEFVKEVTHLINRLSLENGSNTPDYMLAKFLGNALLNLEAILLDREKWYGYSNKPGESLIPAITRYKQENTENWLLENMNDYGQITFLWGVEAGRIAQQLQHNPSSFKLEVSVGNVRRIMYLAEAYFNRKLECLTEERGYTTLYVPESKS